MVSKEFLLAARESRSIVGWVEKRNPTPLTMRSKQVGMKKPNCVKKCKIALPYYNDNF